MKQDSVPDQLLTYKEAASLLGVPYFKIQRAARAGLIPTYSLLNSRRYVKVSDIQRVMAGCAPPSDMEGGYHD